MGTNYYWYKNQPCPTCGHEDERKHIGKSSAGWCFTLHVEPENDIHDLHDWKLLFETPGSYIRDEYGQEVSVVEMLAEITERGREERCWKEKPLGYLSWDDFHSHNHSQAGPKGLLRHQLNWSCIKQGDGTWDCCIGEFS